MSTGCRQVYRKTPDFVLGFELESKPFLNDPQNSFFTSFARVLGRRSGTSLTETKSSNNLVPNMLELSAMQLTESQICEHLVLV